MHLTFLGANRQVTGSCYHLEAGGLRLLIDHGMFQERQYQDRNWHTLPIDIGALDAVLLTHAHLDHCGLLPKLVAEGFKGSIYCTEPTVDLAKLVMEDSAKIQTEDVKTKRKRHEQEGRRSPHPYTPLYTADDAHRAGRLLKGVCFNEAVKLNDAVNVRFLEAGHILGSAMLEINVQGNGSPRRIVFSGDIGQWDVPIVGDPTYIRSADAVIMESTYGDRNHEGFTEIKDQLADAINATAQRGGHVIIPTFAIERAQELMLHIVELIDAGRIPRLPTFLDSPMAVNATEIFRQHRDFMDQQTRELLTSNRLADEWKHVHLVRSVQQSKQVNEHRGPGIIMAGSGMCTGGRIKHHLAHHLGRPEDTILFVGYQAVGTLGRQIVDGHPEVRLFGTMRTVRAEVRRVHGLSAHADKAGLLRWLEHYEQKPRKLFLTHGEEAVSLNLAAYVRQEMGWDVEVPTYKQTVEL